MTDLSSKDPEPKPESTHPDENTKMPHPSNQGRTVCRESLEGFCNISNSLRDAVLIVDETGRIFYWNPAAERIFGHSSDEVIGKDLACLLSDRNTIEQYRRALQGFWTQSAETRAGMTVELRALRKKGKAFPIELSLSPCQLKTRWIGIGIVRDISQRQHMIDSLKRSEERYRLLVENANEAILVAQDGMLKFANPKAEDLLGFPLKDLTNRPFIDFIHPEDRFLVVERHRRRLGGEDLPHVYPFRVVDKLGNIRWVEINAVRFSWEGRPATLNFLADITRRREAEEALREHRDRLEGLIAERTSELRRSVERLQKEILERENAESQREALIAELEEKNRELEQFTHTVSHDLKSPLITIRGYLGRVLKDVERGDHERLRRDLGRITAAADRMERLLDELLELSRIGHRLNPMEEIPLDNLVEEASRMVAGRLNERGVRLEIAPRLPVVRGDRSRLVQVFQNLLDNAAKFLGDQPNPRIRVGVRLTEGGTICYVEDNGVGIAPDYQHRVFGLFEKLDRKSEGTGVGLAIAKRIIERHGGRIWVESEGPGMGSTFCFVLPDRPSSPHGRRPPHKRRVRHESKP